MPPKISFYYAPGACSIGPHILLLESHLSFTLIHNTIGSSGSVFVKDFHLVNPKMQVPVLVLDNEVITETPAICAAISDLVPDLGFMGRTPLERVRVLEWMCWLSGTLHMAGFKHLFRPELYTSDVDGNGKEVVKKKALECIKGCFEIIERKLEGVFVIGNALTAVDPYLFVFFRWGNEVGFEMKREYPKYTKLVENLVERPSLEGYLKAEGIESTL